MRPATCNASAVFCHAIGACPRNPADSALRARAGPLAGGLPRDRRPPACPRDRRESRSHWRAECVCSTGPAPRAPPQRPLRTDPSCRREMLAIPERGQCVGLTIRRIAQGHDRFPRLQGRVKPALVETPPARLEAQRRGAVARSRGVPPWRPPRARARLPAPGGRSRPRC